MKRTSAKTSLSENGRGSNSDALENFNPYGLHAIHIPLGMLTYDPDKLSWAAKALYGRLALFRGKQPDGFCNPNLDQMAAAMGGCSIDSIDRWLAELIQEKFIARKRNGRRAASIVFLRHQALFNSATLRNQDAHSIPQPCPSDSATLPPSIPQPYGSPYKEENIHHQNIHKNKKQNPEVLREPSPVVARPKPEPANPKRSETQKQNFQGFDDEPPKQPQRQTPSQEGESQPQPRAAGATPEKEFLLRLEERHGSALAETILEVVKQELERGGSMAGFVEFDALKTTSPKKLDNPGGHYRKIAQKYSAKCRAEALEAFSFRWKQPVEPEPRCEKCDGFGMVLERIEGERPRMTEAYCVCQTGKDLKAVEFRAKPACRWTPDELSQMCDLLKANPPIGATTPPGLMALTQETLDAGQGADASEVLNFLRRQMETAWVPESWADYPRMVREEFEARQVADDDVFGDAIPRLQPGQAGLVSEQISAAGGLR
jgi:hypothetical protein